MANKSISRLKKKRRNKQYTGVDAALDRPVITKITAANRSKLGQWWFERKKILKPIIITVIVVAIVLWLILELVRVANG